MLDTVSVLCTEAQSRSPKGRWPPDIGRRSGMRCPRAGARHLCSRAASGIMPAGTMTGMRGARCNRGRRRRDTPAIYRRCAREAWPDAAFLGCVSPLGESRRGTPTGERAFAKVRAAPKGTAVTEQRLSAFCFLYLVPRPILMPPATPLPDVSDEDWVGGEFLGMAFTKLGRARVARTRNYCLRPRDSGGGGPSVARIASVGWWRGRLTRRVAFVEGISSRPTPLPPPCCAGWSPLPAIAGRDKGTRTNDAEANDFNSTSSAPPDWPARSPSP
jgi:hypothetical protein